MILSGSDTPTILDTWFKMNTHENNPKAHTVPVSEHTVTLAYGLSKSVLHIEAGVFIQTVK